MRGSTLPPASKAAPVSLASFIGGKATGPRLNKVVAQPETHDPTKFDTRPYVSTASPLAQVARGKGGPASGEISSNRRVRMPGLAVDDHSARNDLTQGRLTASPVAEARAISPTSPRKKAIRRLSNPPDAIHAATDETNPPGFSKPSSLLSSTPALGSTGSSLTRSKSTSATPQTPSRSSAISSPAPYLARPVQPQTPSTPQFIPPSGVAPTFARSLPPKDPSPSLTRLRGRGFVGERIRASVDLSSDTPTKSVETTAPSSAPRRNVLDRWQPAATSSDPSLAIAPAPRSPVKTSATTQIVGTRFASKETDNPTSIKSRSLPPPPVTNFNTTIPLRQSPTSIVREGVSSPILSPPNPNPRIVPATARRSPAPTPSSLEPSRSRGSSVSQTTKTESHVSSKPPGDYTEFGLRKSPVIFSKPPLKPPSAEPPTQPLTPSLKPAISNDSVLDALLPSKPLNHVLSSNCIRSKLHKLNDYFYLSRPRSEHEDNARVPLLLQNPVHSLPLLSKQPHISPRDRQLLYNSRVCPQQQHEQPDHRPFRARQRLLYLICLTPARVP